MVQVTMTARMEVRRVRIGALVFTIAVNYLLGERIRQLKQRRSPRARTVFVAAIGFNALLLVAFKYLLPLAGLSVPIPLGLSFFTLLQIGYHIAVYTEQADTLSAPGYALFVGYFPYVVAGPVVRRKDFPFDPGAGCQPFEPALFLAGAALFVLGIAKKLVFADNLAPEVNAAFAAILFDVDGTLIDPADRPDEGHLRTLGVKAFLKKPFHVRQVIEAIEDSMAVVY